MSKTYKNIRIPYPTEGVIRSAQLNDTVAPENSVQVAVNMNFDRVGAAQTRLGVENFGGSYPSVATLPVLSMGALSTNGAGTTIASYSETNQNTTSALFATSVIDYGQSFQCATTALLNSCKFYMKKTGTPPGNMVAKLYASTGSLGTTSKPTGSALATSETIVANTLTTSLALVSFYFTGINRVPLTASTDYVIVVEYNDGDGSNNVSIGADNSTPTAAGNESYSTDGSTWTAVAGTDVCFYVYGSTVGGIKRLITQIGNTFISWDQSSWTNMGSEGQAVKARYAQYLNRLWRVNGTGNSAVKTTADGITWDSTLVPATFPTADYISAGFEGRIWLGDAVSDVVYFSDIVQFTPPDTYTITFNLATNYIQNLSPQDGETITGFFEVPRALLLFKQNHIYRIYGSTSKDAYPAYNVGTYSQESIVKAKDGVYFHHSSGFYKFTYDSQPTEISRRVIDFVKAIPKANYTNVCGIYDGYDAIEWAVGPVTVEGVTYNNCVMRYTISTQTWTIYDYGGPQIRSMIIYDDGTNINNLIGTQTSTSAAGRLTVIGKLDSGYTDFGSPIYWELVDRWRSFTDMYAKSKSISGINVYTENAGGARLEYQTEKSQPNVYEYIDTVKDQYDALFPNASTKDFANIRLRLKGNNSGTPILYHGMEILSIQDKGFDQN